jgi:hypothetical protein
MGAKRCAYSILVGKPEKTLGRPRRMWENNIKIDIIEIGWVNIDWIDISIPQDTDQWRVLVNKAMNFRVL